MTSFKEYVSKYRDSVYSKIMEYLPLKEPEAHYRMVRDYSERMGSYRRAGFILLTGEMFGEKPENLFLPAAAMQMSEDWILIHDDIEDNSESRRGKPALHKIHGNELAINAGDAVHISMWKALKDYMVSAAGQRGSTSPVQRMPPVWQGVRARASLCLLHREGWLLVAIVPWLSDQHVSVERAATRALISAGAGEPLREGPAPAGVQ